MLAGERNVVDVTCSGHARARRRRTNVLAGNADFYKVVNIDARRTRAKLRAENLRTVARKAGRSGVSLKFVRVKTDCTQDTVSV